MEHCYQPSMELYNEQTVKKVWRDWGIFDNLADATNYAKQIQKDIENGKYDSRKEEDFDIRMCIEIIDKNTFEFVQVIDI